MPDPLLIISNNIIYMLLCYYTNIHVNGYAQASVAATNQSINMQYKLYKHDVLTNYVSILL